jgi:ribose 5-phosphate isomerase B
MMSETVIALASDHGGFALKAELAEWLKGRGETVLDLGPDSADSVDYPDYADRMAEAIRAGKAGLGVLICGSGIGISIAANRHRWIRAALCHDVTTAKLCRAHNDANVLTLGARIIGAEVAKDCLAAFLETPFEGGRHVRRVDKMS